MQVAHRSHVISMLDAAALRGVIEREQPALHRSRDRGDRHDGAGGARGRGLHRDPDRAGRAADHGPRGHPPARRGDTRPRHLALPLRRHAGRIPRRGRRDRHALRREAGDVELRQGPEHRAHRRRRADGLGLRAGRRPGRRRPRHRRGLHRLRLRDHPADRPPRRRHRVLRADRPPAGRRRLPGVLAAPPDEPQGARAKAGASPPRSPASSAAAASSAWSSS